MSNADPKTVTVALTCSVKVSGTLYAPNDVIQVTEDIARRLFQQKAAEPYSIPVEAPAETTDPEDSEDLDTDPADDDADVDEEDAARPAKPKRGGKAS